MRQAAIILLILLLLCPLTSAYSKTDTDIDVCGDVNFFFWNDSSDLGPEYNRLATIPQAQDSVIMSAPISAAAGEKTIGSFVTEPFKDGDIMAPGLTRYRTFLNVSSTVGVTTYNFIPFRVAKDGTETRLFYGVPRTEDVDELDAREYLTSYARRNYTYFEPGERLLIRVNVSTTAVTERTAYFNLAGTGKASMVQIGYWVCDPPAPAPTIPNLPAPPITDPGIPWYIWVLGVLVLLLSVRVIL